MFEIKLFNIGETLQWSIPFDSFTLTEDLNKGMDGTINISYKALENYLTALKTTPDTMLGSGTRLAKIYKDSTLIFNGVVMNRQTRGGKVGATSLTLPIGDYLAFLAKRRTAALRAFTSEDSADIAWTLIDESQNDASGFGDLGITRGSHPTTKDRDRTLRFDNVRDVIVGMSNEKVKDGYDCDIDTSKVFNIYYPAKGTSRPNIVFDDFNIISFTSDEPLAGKLTNRVYVLGVGFGDSQIYEKREDTSVMPNWYLQEDVLSEKDVSQATTLQDRGDQFLTDNKEPVSSFSLTHLDNTPDILDYSVGDTVRVRVDSIGLDDLLRIKKRTIYVEGGSSQVTLSLV
jgi:hypothetical protein